MSSRIPAVSYTHLDVYKRQANGIEVKIPTEMLSEDSAVEFLHDADGSVSLLIKNVIL